MNKKIIFISLILVLIIIISGIFIGNDIAKIFTLSNNINEHQEKLLGDTDYSKYTISGGQSIYLAQSDSATGYVTIKNGSGNTVSESVSISGDNTVSVSQSSFGSQIRVTFSSGSRETTETIRVCLTNYPSKCTSFSVKVYCQSWAYNSGNTFSASIKPTTTKDGAHFKSTCYYFVGVSYSSDRQTFSCTGYYNRCCDSGPTPAAPTETKYCWKKAGNDSENQYQESASSPGSGWINVGAAGSSCGEKSECYRRNASWKYLIGKYSGVSGYDYYGPTCPASYCYVQRSSSGNYYCYGPTADCNPNGNRELLSGRTSSTCTESRACYRDNSTWSYIMGMYSGVSGFDYYGPTCPASYCYVERGSSGNYYCYGPTADCNPNGNRTLLSGRTLNTCTETAKCYQKSNGTYVLGKYEGQSGYTLYGNTCPTTPATQESYCWRKVGNNGQNEYTISTTSPGTGYTKTTKSVSSCSEVSKCYQKSDGTYVTGKYEGQSGYTLYGYTCPSAPVTYACYGNSYTLENSTVVRWATSASYPYSYKITSVKKEVDCVKAACYGNASTIANSTYVYWTDSPTYPYSTKISGITKESDCVKYACYGNRSSNPTAVRWLTSASSPYLYKISGITSSTDCKITTVSQPACYGNGNTLYDSTSVFWTNNPVYPYDNKISGVINQAGCRVIKTYACYGDGPTLAQSNSVVWSTESTSYHNYLLSDITNQSECKIETPKEVLTCDSSNLNQKVTTVGINTCAGTASFNNNQQFGSTCSTFSSSSFYNITCHEVLNVKYNTVYVSAIKANTGIDFKIRITSHIVCDGEFTGFDSFKEAYNNVINNLKIQSLTAEQRQDYTNRKNKLETELNNYNNYTISKAQYDMSYITASLTNTLTKESYNLVANDDLSFSVSNKKMIKNNNLGISDLTNPNDYTFTVDVTRSYNLKKAYYDNSARKIKYTNCTNCVPLEDKIYATNDVINSKFSYRVDVKNLGYSKLWSSYDTCSLSILPETVIYRSIDESNPFISEDRKTGENWINQTFDFSNVAISNNDKTLYEFSLSKDNIRDIKENTANIGISSYLGKDCYYTTDKYACNFIRNKDLFTNIYIDNEKQ